VASWLGHGIAAGARTRLVLQLAAALVMLADAARLAAHFGLQLGWLVRRLNLAALLAAALHLRRL